LDIRANTKVKIRRTEVIQALVAGIRDSESDLTNYGTEAELVEAIVIRMKT
jgi:hypothetical protein